ncbi:MAG TPA: DUF5693 family protein [Candidatus Limnocylindria bacterium]|nr:DUF5693 family protein [Candidatus Limnocylindria bacterium]
MNRLTATRLGLGIALTLATLLMIPGLLERIRIESTHRVYEVTVPATEVESIIESGVDADGAYRQLQEAGVSSIALEMRTVEDLEADGRIAVFRRAELVSQLLLAGEDPSQVPEGPGEYIVLLDGDAAFLDGEDGLAEALAGGNPPRRIEPLEIGGLSMLHVTGAVDVREVVVGYDMELAREIADRGFGLIARVPDTVDGDPDATGDTLDRLNEELGVDRVLFTGSRAPYIDDGESFRRLVERLRATGYSVFLIELLEQEGTARYVERVGSGMRLHAIELEQVDPPTAIDRAVRAVRERNIHTIFLRPTPALSAEGRLEEIVTVAAGVREHLAGDLEPGITAPFEPLEKTPLLVAGAALASLAIVVASGALVHPWLAIVFGLGTAALIGGWLAGIGIAGDLLRLGVAVLASALAVFVARPRERIGPAALEYLGAAAVVFATGLTITALGYEDRFLVGSTDFFGVKALLVAPPAITGLWALYRSLGEPRLRDLPRVARLPIEIWQVVALGIVAAAGLYLVIRSGNTGAAPSWELNLRQWLEDLLYIRPRTKEFLIGFPALIAGILVTARWRHGWWLYAIGSIGTASAIDTFCHFHTPLLVSLLRTAYAVGFGFVIGVVALLVVRRAWPPVRDFALRHWG